MSRCHDGTTRTGSSVLVICIDNLNGIAFNPNHKPANAVTFEKFRANNKTIGEITRLMDLLSRCDRAIYVRTTKAEKWQMLPFVDDISLAISNLARDKGIATLESE